MLLTIYSDHLEEQSTVLGLSHVPSLLFPDSQSNQHGCDHTLSPAELLLLTSEFQVLGLHDCTRDTLAFIKAQAKGISSPEATPAPSQHHAGHSFHYQSQKTHRHSPTPAPDCKLQTLQANCLLAVSSCSPPSHMCVFSRLAVSDSDPTGWLSMGFSRQEYWSGLPVPSRSS